MDLSVRRSGSIGVGVILRTGARDSIGRPTHFLVSFGRQPPATATTPCLTAQRVAETRLDTPIFV